MTRQNAQENIKSWSTGHPGSSALLNCLKVITHSIYPILAASKIHCNCNSILLNASGLEFILCIFKFTVTY